MKYHPEANNDVVSILEAEGAEVVMPDFVDFFLYTLHNSTFRYKELAGRHRDKVYGDMGIRYIESLRKNMKKALDESVHFEAPKSIREIAKGAEKHLSIGHQTGEGWFLTGEMVELIESGVNNVFCLQPFGCLPNHIVGKGMIKELRKSYPKANIVPIDYDPGVSEVNQVNRIKLMLSVAKQALEEECRENVI